MPGNKGDTSNLSKYLLVSWAMNEGGMV
jgi:hypothetical protein